MIPSRISTIVAHLGVSASSQQSLHHFGSLAKQRSPVKGCVSIFIPWLGISALFVASIDIIASF